MKILRWLCAAVWLSSVSAGPAFAAEAATEASKSLDQQVLPPANQPSHARVIAVRNDSATESFRCRPEVVDAMVDAGLKRLTGKPTIAEAWRSLVGSNGVISGEEVIGVKCYSLPGPTGGTRPAVVAAVIEGLLAAGVARQNVIIWDKDIVTLRSAGFVDLARRYRVRVQGSQQAGYDPETFYDYPLPGNLLWGDVEFGRTGEGVGRKSYLSKIVKPMTKIINVTPLLNHYLAGVSGNLYGLATGSIDNANRFETDAHAFSIGLVDIYSLHFYDRVVLNIVDALLCQYEGGERGLLHYSTILNELRFSRDPVALDILSIRELQRQRGQVGLVQPRAFLELYRNAAKLELGIDDPARIDVETVGN